MKKPKKANKPRRGPLAKAIQKQIDFWQSNQNDPHQIGNAVLAALYAVQGAIIESEMETAGRKARNAK